MNWRTVSISSFVLLGLWAITGVYTIGPNEQGVRVVMGEAATGPVPPGLHWRLPYPMARVIRVKMRETRRVGVGTFLIEEATGAAGATGRNEFATGDRNLVNLELVVQYGIKDPISYLFRSSDVDAFIAALTESAVSRAVAAMSVNDVLYESKVRIQQQARAALSGELAAYELGVTIGSVSLQKVRPVPEVEREFNDVVTAKADALRTINEAESYANDILPRSRGEAAAMVEQARADAFSVEHAAIGEADRFVNVVSEYRRAPALTRTRLYMEALERILRRTRKVVVDPADGASVVHVGRAGAGSSRMP